MPMDTAGCLCGQKLAFVDLPAMRVGTLSLSLQFPFSGEFRFMVDIFELLEGFLIRNTV